MITQMSEWMVQAMPSHARFFRNVQGRFYDVSKQCGSFFSRRQVERGAAFGDYDNDGDTDVLIACNNQPAILLRNDSPQRSHWIRLALQGSRCNRDALGAQVRVQASGMTQMQYMRSRHQLYVRS